MSPSRCPDCQSRLLQPHGVMDTFERYAAVLPLPDPFRADLPEGGREEAA